jgi:hypothetical protein
VNAEIANDIVDDTLATVMHLLRAAVSRSLGNHSPGEVAFHRHMFLNLLPLLANLQILHDKRAEIMRRNLELANQKRIRYDYQQGEMVAIKQVNSKFRSQDGWPLSDHTGVHECGSYD